MLYLLNSPVLTSHGQYAYSACSLDEARKLMRGGFVSAIGHASSASLLSMLLLSEIPVNRIAIAMQPADRALVLSLKTRLPEGTVLDAETLQNTPYELGLLERLS